MGSNVNHFSVANSKQSVILPLLIPSIEQGGDNLLLYLWLCTFCGRVENRSPSHEITVK